MVRFVVPAQRTVELCVKPLPFTVMVTLELPAVVELGVTLLMVTTAAVMVNGSELDVMPLCRTVMEAVPAEARSDAGTVAATWVVERDPVESAVEFQ